VIFSLLMIQNGFIAPSINIENLDPAAKGFDIVANEAREARVDTVLSNSFGFGGTNASIIVRKYRG
jgi:3-oxoacyl-[acyl-carrier-protein] synthase-1